MSSPFIAEIVMFGGNFAPRAWAFCDGQLLPIAQNQALFSLVGTIYGGDGRTTFALPDLRGRVPMHPGNGPGLTPRPLGQKSGVEGVTLTANQMPNHTHTGEMKVADGLGDAFGAKNNFLATKAIDVDTSPNTTVEIYKSGATAAFTKGNKLMGTEIGATGGSQSHTNVQPFTCINFIIALQGVFPSRN